MCERKKLGREGGKEHFGLSEERERERERFGEKKMYRIILSKDLKILWQKYNNAF